MSASYDAKGIRSIDEFVKADATIDYQDVLCPGDATYNGQIYGLPQKSCTHQLACNKDLFAAAGLPTPGELYWKDKLLAPLVEAVGITVVVEPLNVLVDHPGYYLTTSAEGFEILDEVGSQAVKLLFDIYHQQITEGNLLANIVPHIKQIGHFHVADVPGRHEPGTGEINYANVFHAIDKAGYEGFVGLEYWPTVPAADTLRTVRALALA
jgi:hypothetical protein